MAIFWSFLVAFCPVLAMACLIAAPLPLGSRNGLSAFLWLLAAAMFFGWGGLMAVQQLA